MGVLTITTRGSFGPEVENFSAMTHGHAHAVSQAIEFLSSKVLPDAIALDHGLQEMNEYPTKGFDKPDPLQETEGVG